MRGRSADSGDARGEVIVAAFGKFPGWDDHISDAALTQLPSDAMRRVSAALYLGAYEQAVNEGRWRALPPGVATPSFYRSFARAEAGSLVTGRIWSSIDGGLRSEYPMIVCAEAEVEPPSASAVVALDSWIGPICDELRRRAESAQVMIESHRGGAGPALDQELLRAEVRSLVASLRRTSPGSGETEPGQGWPERLADWPGWGPDRVGLWRVAYALDRRLGGVLSERPGARRSKTDTARLRSVAVQVRVPAGDLPGGAACGAWIEWLRALLPPLLPVMVCAPVEGGYADLIIGTPGPAEIVCLRVGAHEQMPLESDVPYSGISAEFIARVMDRLSPWLSAMPTMVEAGPEAAAAVDGAEASEPPHMEPESAAAEPVATEPAIRQSVEPASVLPERPDPPSPPAEPAPSDPWPLERETPQDIDSLGSEPAEIVPAMEGDANRDAAVPASLAPGSVDSALAEVRPSSPPNLVDEESELFEPLREPTQELAAIEKYEDIRLADGPLVGRVVERAVEVGRGGEVAQPVRSSAPVDAGTHARLHAGGSVAGSGALGGKRIVPGSFWGLGAAAVLVVGAIGWLGPIELWRAPERAGREQKTHDVTAAPIAHPGREWAQRNRSAIDQIEREVEQIAVIADGGSVPDQHELRAGAADLRVAATTIESASIAGESERAALQEQIARGDAQLTQLRARAEEFGRVVRDGVRDETAKARSVRFGSAELDGLWAVAIEESIEGDAFKAGGRERLRRWRGALERLEAKASAELPAGEADEAVRTREAAIAEASAPLRGAAPVEEKVREAERRLAAAGEEQRSRSRARENLARVSEIDARLNEGYVLTEKPSGDSQTLADSAAELARAGAIPAGSALEQRISTLRRIESGEATEEELLTMLGAPRPDPALSRTIWMRVNRTEWWRRSGGIELAAASARAVRVSLAAAPTGLREDLDRRAREETASAWLKWFGWLTSTEPRRAREGLDRLADFGLSRDSAEVPLWARYDMLLAELLHDVSPQSEPGDAEGLRRRIAKFCEAVEGLGAGISPEARAWVRGLADWAVRPARGMADIEAHLAAVGPGRRQWKVTEVGKDGERVTYAWQGPGGPHELTFERVSPPGASGISYLCTTEMSVGLFMDLVASNPDESKALWKLFGPNEFKNDVSIAAWSRSGEAISLVPGWQINNINWLPRAERSSPLQQVSPAMAIIISGLAGCRPQTLAEWQAARAMQPETDGWNLRDQSFAAMQRRLDKESNGTAPIGGVRDLAMDAHQRGVATATGVLVANTEDGWGWFAPVDDGPGRTFVHLVGNVAEYAYARSGDLDRALAAGPVVPRASLEIDWARQVAKESVIVGGSAVSDFTKIEQPATVAGRGSGRRYPDVGVRLAFGLLRQDVPVVADEQPRALLAHPVWMHRQ